MCTSNRAFNDHEAQVIVAFQNDNNRSIDKLTDDDVFELRKRLNLEHMTLSELRALLGRERRKSVKEVGTRPYLNMNGKRRGRTPSGRTPGRLKSPFDGMEMAVLDIADINIHEGYQRLINSSRASKMARQFTPHAFGTVHVGERSNKTLWCVDGGHRVTAAKETGQKQIPCTVFQSEGEQHEARVFVMINDGRKNLTSIDLWNAAIVMRDEETLAIETMLCEHGLKIANSSVWPNIKAAAAVRKIYRTKTLEAVLSVVDWAKSFDRFKQKEMVSSNILFMLSEIFRMYGPVIDPGILYKRLSAVTATELRDLCQRNAGSGGERGRKLAKSFIEEIYNTNLRANRIDTDGYTRRRNA